MSLLTAFLMFGYIVSAIYAIRLKLLNAKYKRALEIIGDTHPLQVESVENRVLTLLELTRIAREALKEKQ